MSCGCSDNYNSNSAYNGYCNADTPYPSVSHESVPSLIDNLVTALYGEIQKDVSSGKVVWNIPCDPSNIPATINGIPRNDGEGLLCYIVRALNLTTPSGFVTVNGVQTLTNKTLVSPTITGSGAIAGVFTGNVTGNLTGNATTATTLATARTIAISGDVTGTATSFNGSANISIPVTINAGSVTPADLSTGGPSWNASGDVTKNGDLYQNGTNTDYNVVSLTNTSGVQVQIAANGNVSGDIRTVTNHPLTFLTNNAERLRIDSDGNVGIGTSSPVSDLEIKDGTRSLRIDANLSPTGNTYISASGSTDGLIIGTSDAKSVSCYTNNTLRLSVESTGTINAQSNPITNCPTTAKAWGSVNSTGTLGVSYGVNTSAKGGTGIYTITSSTTLPANYIIIATSDSVFAFIATTAVVSTTQFQIRTFGSGGTASDVAFKFAVFSN
jgi:hypothetical protein